MHLNDFDYELPKELIAQSPLDKRDSSKLMVLDKTNKTIEHKHFYDILNYLDENDVLILNDTKVFPARLYGKKISTNANIEILLLSEINKDEYEALVKPARRIKINDEIIISNELKLKCLDVKPEGIRIFKMIYKGILLEHLEKLGEMPTPPYITKKLENNDKYQTIYANDPKSAAAPTAGLHFTNELLTEISKKIEIIKITLHVGLGTFRPVEVENILDHKMHEEKYFISEEAANKLNKAYQNKKRFVAVGTTTLRALESNFNKGFHKGAYATNIFIYPGYEFKCVDALITNFHLPKSTLLMLVSAFSNKEFIIKAYNEAIKNNYRFFSFGDAMLLK